MRTLRADDLSLVIHSTLLCWWPLLWPHLVALLVAPSSGPMLVAPYSGPCWWLHLVAPAGGWWPLLEVMHRGTSGELVSNHYQVVRSVCLFLVQPLEYVNFCRLRPSKGSCCCCCCCCCPAPCGHTSTDTRPVCPTIYSHLARWGPRTFQNGMERLQET